MARRYGWTIKVLPDDCSCRIAREVYRWEGADLSDASDLANFALGLYASSVENERGFVENLQPLERAAKGVVISPLEWTKIEPDVVLIFGNAAQMMRLIQSYLYVKGGVLTFTATGRAGSCSDGVVKAFVNQEPRLVVLGNGDRVWGMAQDDELLFALPSGQLDDLLEGLEATNEAGLRYPVPSYMNFAPGFQAEFEERALQRSGTTIIKK
jgi:uncharacterized protein (DUF169 family)